MLIDPSKLKRSRLLVDEVITETALVSNTARHWARHRIAENLGFDLSSGTYGSRAPEGSNAIYWWYASAISLEEASSSCLDDEDEIYFEAELRQKVHCQATSAEDAEMAVLCRLLDEAVDLAMSREGQITHYGSECEECPFTVWITMGHVRLAESRDVST